jgi:hypothetical protein
VVEQGWNRGSNCCLHCHVIQGAAELPLDQGSPTGSLRAKFCGIPSFLNTKKSASIDFNLVNLFPIISTNNIDIILIERFESTLYSNISVWASCSSFAVYKWFVITLPFKSLGSLRNVHIFCPFKIASNWSEIQCRHC